MRICFGLACVYLFAARYGKKSCVMGQRIMIRVESTVELDLRYRS